MKKHKADRARAPSDAFVITGESYGQGTRSHASIDSECAGSYFIDIQLRGHSGIAVGIELLDMKPAHFGRKRGID